MMFAHYSDVCAPVGILGCSIADYSTTGKFVLHVQVFAPPIQNVLRVWRAASLSVTGKDDCTSSSADGHI